MTLYVKLRSCAARNLRNEPAFGDTVMVLNVDARHLPNPHKEPVLRERTGQDPVVRQWLDAQGDGLCSLSRWICDAIEHVGARVANGSGRIEVNVFCHGGRHRSVAVVERVVDLLAGGRCPLLRDVKVVALHNELG